MEEPVTVKLKHPIEFGKDTVIEELTFRRGRLGDLKGVVVQEHIPVDDLIMVAGRLCGQPAAVMAKLDEDDAGEVLALALGFLGRCLTTGMTP